MQTSWLAQHEYVGAWIATFFGGVCALGVLVGMWSQAKSAGVSIKWDAVVVRVGFFPCLAGITSPGLTEGIRTVLAMFAGWTLFSIINSRNSTP